jgi:hypothetical protein
LERGKELKALAVALALCLAAVTPAFGAKPKPNVLVVRGGQYVQLDALEGGAVIACLASRDSAGKPRVRCALASNVSGVVIPDPDTTVFELGARGLVVATATNVDGGQPLYSAAEPQRPTLFGRFRDDITGSYPTFVYGKRYAFTGTDVLCTTARSELAITCLLVDAKLRPLRGSYGFTLGFKSFRVTRQDGSGPVAVYPAGP